MNTIDSHVQNNSNPHGVTLSQLGYSESETFKRFINLLYPIGRVILSLTNINPGTYLPGTTWELIAGNRYLKGVPNTSTIPSTGGRDSYTISHSHSINSHTHTISHTHSIPAHSHSITHNHTCDNHTLTTAELPSHNHSVGAHSHGLNNHAHSISINTGGMSANSCGNFADFACASSDAAKSPYVDGIFHGRPYKATDSIGYATDHKTVNVTNVDNGHIVGDHVFADVSHTHLVSGNTGGNSGSTANSSAFNSGNTGSGSGHNHSIQNYTGNTGNSSALTSGGSSNANSGGTSLNTNSTSSTITLDPSYQTVYIWKRTK